jgi:pyridoxine 4-dehydrogenase
MQCEIERFHDTVEAVGIFLLDRSSEGVLDACAQAGVAFLPWAPLISGESTDIPDALAAIAARHSATPSQIGLAWLLAQVRPRAVRVFD